MRKIAATLLVIATLLPVAVFASDFPILDMQVEIRQRHLEWTTTIVNINMDAIIDYIDEISEGNGTSELLSLSSDFDYQIDKMKDLTTHVALDNALRQLANTIADFGSETRRQMSEYDSKPLELLSRIKDSFDNSQGELDALQAEYWETRKTNALGILDIRIVRAQDVLTELGRRGHDVEEAQRKLNQIIEKSSVLEDALNEKDSNKIHQVNLEILELSKELVGIVRDLQVEIPKKRIVSYWITVGSRVLERTDTIISELEKLGIDVAKLKDIHSKARTDLETAQQKFEDDKLDEAIEALKVLKADFVELKEAYEELVNNLSGNMKTKIELTINALSDTVEHMEDSI